MCECFQIGGPFIAEDPSCPLHGEGSRGRDERLEGIVQRAVDGEITVEQAVSLIEEDYYS